MKSVMTEGVAEKETYWHEWDELTIVSNNGFGIYSDPLSDRTVKLFKEQVEKYKPDVLFISASFSEYFKIPIQPNDTIVQNINDNIKYYEKFVKKIYILGSLPLYKQNFINHFLQYAMQKPEDFEELHLNQKLADEERKYAVERLKMLKCERCKIYDLSPAFLENEKYNTGLRGQLDSFDWPRTGTL